jgi:hypothetical protein
MRPVRALGVTALAALVLSLVPPVADGAAAAVPTQPSGDSVAAGKLRDPGPAPQGVTRLSKPARPASSYAHQAKTTLGLKSKSSPKSKGSAMSQEGGFSCWPYFNWGGVGWVDDYLEESAELDYLGGVDCDISLTNMYVSTGIIDHSPAFNGQWFDGIVLSAVSGGVWFSPSVAASGGVQFSSHFYNGGRIVEGLVELWLEAPPDMIWDWCSPVGLYYYACDGIGTSSLHLLLGTGWAYSGVTAVCRDQSAALNDAEIDRISRPAPGTGVWASTQLVRSVPAIVDKVMAFKRDLCSTAAGSAQTFATTRGKELWDTAVAEAKKNTANGDDRPLYWARLHMLAALRQWRAGVDTTSAQQSLDRASRGMTSDTFSGATAKKAFISGFDPFDLDSTADGPNAVMRGNPSAAAVLRLDGQTIGGAEVQAVIFPVRYKDFSDGLVEQVLQPHLVPGPQQATLINTVSQGGSSFELEVYYGRRRSSDLFTDNQNKLSGPNGGSGGTATSPIVAFGAPESPGSPEFTVSSLPDITGTCTSCLSPHALVRDTSVIEQSPPGSAPQQKADGPSPGSLSVAGSGGGFLSNELPYRVTLQRNLLQSTVPIGHVHTPALAAIPDPSGRYAISGQYQRILTALLGESQDTTPPGVGIAYTPTGDAGQCGNWGQQWAASGWTIPIRFDTDNRSGGCQLAFGISDPQLSLGGLTLTYQWQVIPGSDSRQCGNQGTFQMPMTSYRVFGTPIVVDTDDKSGGCNLTFTMSGRNDVALDIQFWPDGDAGQCLNYLPQGQYRTVRAGTPVTIGINTDGRSGGCQFSLRLRRI